MRPGRCWISASAASSRRRFGDIFYNNSFKNGVLPIRLPRAVCDELIEDAKLGGNARITIDLERQVVVRPNGEEIHFDIDPFRKHLLLNGWTTSARRCSTQRRSMRHEATAPAVSNPGCRPPPA